MYKGRIVVQVLNDKNEVAEQRMECSAPSIEMLNGVVKDMLFTRSAQLSDYLFSNLDFKPIKKVQPAVPAKVSKPVTAKAPVKGKSDAKSTKAQS